MKFICLNKCIKSVLYLHSAFRELIYNSKCIKLLSFLNTVAKTCEKVLRLNMTSALQIYLLLLTSLNTVAKTCEKALRLNMTSTLQI